MQIQTDRYFSYNPAFHFAQLLLRSDGILDQFKIDV